MLAMWEIVPS